MRVFNVCRLSTSPWGGLFAQVIDVCRDEVKRVPATSRLLARARARALTVSTRETNNAFRRAAIKFERRALSHGLDYHLN